MIDVFVSRCYGRIRARPEDRGEAGGWRCSGQTREGAWRRCLALSSDARAWRVCTCGGCCDSGVHVYVSWLRACVCVVSLIVHACIDALDLSCSSQERYSSFHSGIGAKIYGGTATLEDCEVRYTAVQRCWKTYRSSMSNDVTFRNSRSLRCEK